MYQQIDESDQQTAQFPVSCVTFYIVATNWPEGGAAALQENVPGSVYYLYSDVYILGKVTVKC